MSKRGREEKEAEAEEEPEYEFPMAYDNDDDVSDINEFLSEFEAALNGRKETQKGKGKERGNSS